MIHEPAKITEHVILLKRNGSVIERYIGDEVPNRSRALELIAMLRSARPEETIELITTEVFQ
jgi:hypothetical protein